MPETPRLSIELKSLNEIKIKNEARAKALSNGISLHDIIMKALSEFCAKKN